ncbi:hypothetical protein EI77_04779 [Prosthecobacter fusiformis]|uniref:Uncharacterized protein n=1 Tax=Prosthecobacter fusiformis TaxID=48464 RepID=A0A4R7RJ56_9BACT|nr:hypothetical protein [Prosthecobacter fusiformis]TDU62071.1 hypothetical protein EI77_04779 [Prosthecobacter fusiformis]
MKIISQETVYTLCALFDLPEPGDYCINWAHEVEIAPERILPVLEQYDRDFLDQDERLCLMDFLLNSLEEAVRNNAEPDGVWPKFVSLLIIDAAELKDLIDYWSCWDHADTEIEDAFAITPRMREVAKKITNM